MGEPVPPPVPVPVPPVPPPTDMRIKLPRGVDSDDESHKALIAEPDTPTKWPSLTKWRKLNWRNWRYGREKLRHGLRYMCLPRRLAKTTLVLGFLGVILFVVINLAQYARTGRSKLTDPWTQELNPKVYLQQGIYQGASHQIGPQFIDYFHLPYAQTTAGENRFRAPKKLPDDAETLNDATQWRDKCWAGNNNDKEQNGDDCLNMNLWRPRGIKLQEGQDKVPVAIYLHGGAFNFGSGTGRDVEKFVAYAVNPMIGITINYRMGAMGFLSGNFTAEEAELNVGLKDIYAALTWIQENIRNFGGDPEQVTVWGTSAGAHAVGHLLMAHVDKKPPFARALMESGGPTARGCYPHDHPLHEQQLLEFLEFTGASNLPDSEKMAHLRNLSSEMIQAASEHVYNRYDKQVKWPWQPVIDGDFIPKAPIESWEAAEYHRVPILTGFNTDEGNIFVDHYADEPKDFDNFFKELLPAFNKTDMEELNAMYPDPSKYKNSPYVDTRLGLGKQFKRLARAFGDYAYITPVLHTAHYASTLGRPDDRPLFLYQFDANQSVADGASHGGSNAYIELSSSRLDIGGFHNGLAIQMHAYFSSFILTGAPDGVRKGPAANRTPWPEYGKRGSSAKMVFGEHNDQMAGGTNQGGLTEMRPDLRFGKESKFWWSRVIKSES